MLAIDTVQLKSVLKSELYFLLYHYNIEISVMRTLDTVPLESVFKSEQYFLSL